MTSMNTGIDTASAEQHNHLSPELAGLMRLASRVLNEHLNDADLCAICGSAWPCERVQLAEHNLALV